MEGATKVSRYARYMQRFCCFAVNLVVVVPIRQRPPVIAALKSAPEASGGRQCVRGTRKSASSLPQPAFSDADLSRNPVPHGSRAAISHTVIRGRIAGQAGDGRRGIAGQAGDGRRGIAGQAGDGRRGIAGQAGNGRSLGIDRFCPSALPLRRLTGRQIPSIHLPFLACLRRIWPL